MESQVTISEQLVSEGNEQADREQRIAAGGAEEHLERDAPAKGPAVGEDPNCVTWADTSNLRPRGWRMVLP